VWHISAVTCAAVLSILADSVKVSKLLMPSTGGDIIQECFYDNAICVGIDNSSKAQ
jgi:hypothetical protein